MRINCEWSPAQWSMFYGDRAKSNKRVYAKGRRLGATLAGMRWIALSLLSGQGPALWVETQYSDIKRYRHLYLEPFLADNKIKATWDGSLNRLIINGQYADFRSSQNPKALEGQKYRKAFLNEAGIILKRGGVADGEYLVENAIMPMLWNYDDSEIIIAGTPKADNYFKTLYDRGQNGEGGWYSYTYTSYDTPTRWLNHKNLKDYEDTHSPYEVRQEIYGEFLSDKEKILKPEWITFCADQPDKYENIILGLDVAISKSSTADYSAAVVLGVSGDQVYVVGTYKDRLEFHELLKWIVDIADKHHPTLVAVETNAFQKAVYTELKRTTSLNLLAVPSKTDKVSRFFPAASAYSQRRIIHTSSVSPEFVREILDFSASSLRDDYCDALSIAYNSIPTKSKPIFCLFDPYAKDEDEDH